jgi:FkbM family methyltransferase
MSTRVLTARPWLRSMADTVVAQTLVQTARGARVLTPAYRFAAGQLTSKGAAAGYRLRASGAAVHLRHRARDVAILSEVFPAGTYEPPGPADALLEGPIAVIDLGGNVGLFGVFARERWDVERMATLEPDPANLQLLQATARGIAGWQVVGAAASTEAGEMRFVDGMESESRAARPGETGIVVPAVDVFELPGCDLLKIDSRASGRFSLTRAFPSWRRV